MYDMMKERSYWQGISATNRRIIYKAAGYDGQDIENKPHIGIANTFFEGSPGTGHLRRLAESVKQGVWMNGGMPIEFGVPATCGNIATGSNGLRYELVARDVVAMAIENVVRVHKFDGLVILASCDNIIAGAYLAALRVGIPTIVVTGGPMYSGRCGGRKVVQAEVDVASLKGDEAFLRLIEDCACPSFGACPSMGTANTMQILGEALNLVLPGTATVPAGDNLKLRRCVEAGRFVVGLARRGVCPEDLITNNVLLNAIMLYMAIAGSTNAILHILAYSRELGLDITVDDFDRTAREIKCLVGVIPSGELDIIDLHEAGGVPALMKRLQNKIHGDERTLYGDTWEDYLNTITVPHDSIIRTLEDPFVDTAGMRILKGNLAEKCAVCRPTGVPKSMWRFSGKARVFDQEEDAYAAIMADRIVPGDVVVIRYEGCKGSPGMNELMKATDGLLAKGLEEKVALVSDGRFSGFNHGSIIGHISPEAYEGGTLALVREGDVIAYDIPAGILELKVPEDELEARKAAWARPEPKIRKGLLAIYGATCRPSDEGGAMQCW